MDNQDLIKSVVEKATKGVKKQIKGYVERISAEIQSERRHIVYATQDFQRIMDSCKNIKSDFSALDLMVREHNENRKTLVEIRESLNYMNNRMLDLELLAKDIENKCMVYGIGKKDFNIGRDCET